jgi:very-short-patch-repair endonuclease
VDTGHRVDALIGARLVLQIDGKHHVGAQRTENIRHDAELTLLGYHVIRVSYTQMMFDWPQVQDLILRAVAQGLHRAA